MVTSPSRFSRGSSTASWKNTSNIISFRIDRRSQSAVAFGEHFLGGSIDGNFSTPEDNSMSETTYTMPRRSNRVFHKMRLRAQGRAHNGKKFTETCESVVVNAHGGLLLLKNEIDQGEMIVLTNPETMEEIECRVVYLGEPGDRGQRVGVEFLTPAPHFWGVEFAGSSHSTVH